MKFMMNGALTHGNAGWRDHRDGGRGWGREPVSVRTDGGTGGGSRDWYSPYWHYENEPETKAALDLIFSGHFNRNEPGIFDPLRDVLLTGGDYYMHLADLTSYCEAQDRLDALYAIPSEWAKKAVLNVSSSGKFSSDRTIAQYAAEIWRAEPCPIP